jgi:hypothetical protein
MQRSIALAALAFVLAAGAALAFEVGATIRGVDLDHRTVTVFAGGQLRTVRVAPGLRVVDREGKELPEGLRSKELKDGSEVTLTVERDGDEPVIRAIRLGRTAVPSGQSPPITRVDTSKLVPLTELGQGRYQGFEGALYPGGKNRRPASHEAAGLALAKRVQPLDAEGRPSADGKIVLLSVGMSNTTQEFSAFRALADASPRKNPKLLLVDGAQGAMPAAAIQNPDDHASGTRYWTTVDERLGAVGATRAQVQAAWIKEADAGPSQDFPDYARKLQGELQRIVQAMHSRFPNLKLAYLSSRIYGGYARTPLNPEPYAYESGFAVKWLIAQQLGGDPELNFNPARGPVKAPWISWGPYLWANGMKQRADGLFYAESDVGPDGTHPSPSGRRKVAEQLWNCFSTDSTTRGWFLRQ